MAKLITNNVRGVALAFAGATLAILCGGCLNIYCHANGAVRCVFAGSRTAVAGAGWMMYGHEQGALGTIPCALASFVLVADGLTVEPCADILTYPYDWYIVEKSKQEKE